LRHGTKDVAPTVTIIRYKDLIVFGVITVGLEPQPSVLALLEILPANGSAHDCS
jgi:hypothetical protein